MKTIITLFLALAISCASKASELFLKINMNGGYKVTAFNQIEQNGNNVYKFFDLPSGSIPLRVVDKTSDIMLFNGNILLQPNERVIAEINAYGQITILQQLHIQRVNWYTTVLVNTPYVGAPIPYNPGVSHNNHEHHHEYHHGHNHGNHNGHGHFNQPTGPVPVSSQSLNAFITSMKKEPFDNNRLKMAKNYAATNPLTAAQIADIAGVFTFATNRLNFAEDAYAGCIDKNNYFLLKDKFTFSANYNKLLNYIQNQ